MNHTKNLVLSALFCALCCIMTAVLPISVPMGGYVHLGDCFVLLSGLLLPPLYGALAAGLGSMLADLFTGYSQYAAATFIIKALMALCAGGVFRAALKATKKTGLSLFLSGLAAETLMATGYFLFSAWLLGSGVLAALSTLPMNALQGLFGLVSAQLLYLLILKNKTLKKGFIL